MTYARVSARSRLRRLGTIAISAAAVVAAVAVSSTVSDVGSPDPAHAAHTHHACPGVPDVTPLGAIPPALPMFCDELNHDVPQTFVSEGDTWIDEFNHGGTMADLGSGYQQFQVGQVTRSANFRHSNHWMVDIGDEGDSMGGNTMRPNRAFRAVNGKLVIEAEVANDITGYGGNAWPEITVSTAPAPTGTVVDELYTYGQFGGHHTLGVRLHGTSPILALYDDTGRNTAAGGRTWELSFFQHEGTPVITHGGMKHCDDEDPDVYCRNTFRWEITKTGYSIFVNGQHYQSHLNLPPGKQIPDALLNGDVYVYFGSWTYLQPNTTVRFHWDRLAVNPPGDSPHVPAPPPVVPTTPVVPLGSSSEYVAVQPRRFLDTRTSTRADGGQVTRLQVAGETTGVPSDTKAVVLNVTGTEAGADGYVTVYPCGQAAPNASNLNLTTGATTPNLVIAKVGTNGEVCLFTYAPTHLIADIAGYFPASSTFAGLQPERLLDTRTGARPDGGDIVEVQVAGRAGVPADATAAVLNVTGTEAGADGYVTAYPCGQPVPNASNLNLASGSTTPNLAISKIGAGGKVCLFTYGPTHLIADIAGYLPSNSSYTGLVPERLLDTRTGARPDGGDIVEVQVAGRAGVPADALAAVINVTGTEAGADGYVTAYPCGQPVPNASNLNLTPGSNTPNLTVTKIGAGGKVCLFTYGPSHLIADIAGYFPAD